jgi:hypothetical protein
MNASEFKKHVVDPILSEAESNPLVFHRAFALILAVDAWAAHIFHDMPSGQMPNGWPAGVNGRTDSAFREGLARMSADFGLLRDCAKALKHVRLDFGNPRVQSTTQIGEKSLGYGEGGYGEGPYGGGPQIVVEENIGSVRNVISLCDSSIDFLGRILGQQQA